MKSTELKESNLKIELLPVLELQPASFSKPDRESPSNTHAEAPEEWLQYNDQCYSDSGLDDIMPIEPSSWFFKISELPEAALKIILKNVLDSALENFESVNEMLANPIEYAPLLPGGYLFMVNNEIISRPGCCCGLEDIIEWKESDNVAQGHEDQDLVNIRRIHGMVEISIQDESFGLSEQEYNKMLKKAESSIEEFINKSAAYINEILGITTGHSFAKAMIYK